MSGWVWLAVAFGIAPWIAVWWMKTVSARRFDAHADDALALAHARDRHPATRTAPRCQCGRHQMAVWTAGVIDRTHPDGEKTRHDRRLCQPLREWCGS